MGSFKLQINWVDFVILLLLAIGLIRGRKRGMSEEVLDLVKWVLIVVLAGHLYLPVGNMIASMTPFGHLTCYVAVYATTLIVFQVFFSAIKKAVGEKLITSDAFGDGEYYMGMVAGVFRYVCVIIVCLAFINARLYTAEEMRADENFQENNFGSIRLPTSASWGRLQRTVFEGSFTGMLAHNYLATYLIRSTAPEDKRLGGGQIIHARERYNDQMLDKK